MDASPKQPKTMLRDALKAMAEAVPNVAAHFAELEKTANIAELLRAYKQLQDANSFFGELKKILDELQTNLNKKAIPDIMESLQMDSVKSGGYTFSIGVRTFASIPLDKRDEGFKWLEANGLSAIIKPAVNQKTLSSAIKSFIEEKGIIPPEDVMTIHQEKYVSVRKS